MAISLSKSQALLCHHHIFPMNTQLNSQQRVGQIHQSRQLVHHLHKSDHLQGRSPCLSLRIYPPFLMSLQPPIRPPTCFPSHSPAAPPSPPSVHPPIPHAARPALPPPSPHYPTNPASP